MRICIRSQTAPPYPIFRIILYWNQVAFQDHLVLENSARATAQGFCYNAGRGLSAFAPAVIGALADRYGIGAALGVTPVFFLGGAVVMLWLRDGPVPSRP